MPSYLPLRTKRPQTPNTMRVFLWCLPRHPKGLNRGSEHNGLLLSSKAVLAITSATSVVDVGGGCAFLW